MKGAATPGRESADRCAVRNLIVGRWGCGVLGGDPLAADGSGGGAVGCGRAPGEDPPAVSEFRPEKGRIWSTRRVGLGNGWGISKLCTIEARGFWFPIFYCSFERGGGGARGRARDLGKMGGVCSQLPGSMPREI